MGAEDFTPKLQQRLHLLLYSAGIRLEWLMCAMLCTHFQVGIQTLNLKVGQHTLTELLCSEVKHFLFFVFFRLLELCLSVHLLPHGDKDSCSNGRNRRTLISSETTETWCHKL